MLAASIERMKQEVKMQGKLEGKLEGKIETAKKMIEKGLSLNLISECLDLSEDEIRKLLQ